MRMPYVLSTPKQTTEVYRAFPTSVTGFNDDLEPLVDAYTGNSAARILLYEAFAAARVIWDNTRRADFLKAAVKESEIGVEELEIRTCQKETSSSDETNV